MSQYPAQSERLWLEPLAVDKHLDGYHEMISDPRVQSWTKPTESIAESKAYLVERTPNPEKPWIENYAILLRPSSPASVDKKPRLIGALGMIRFEAGHGAEVGYGLHPGYHGKGYATEAMKLFLGLYWSKERKGDWNTLVAAIDPENTSSQRVVEKVGFKEGNLQEEQYELWTKGGKEKKLIHSYYSSVSSERLLLEPLNLDKHLHECHEILSEPRVAEWSTRAPHVNLEQTKERIVESMSSVQFQLWAIMIPTTSPSLIAVEDERGGRKTKMIGIIGTSHTPANVGYKIHLDYWEKRFLPQIAAAYTPGNYGSARVLEKVGFKNGQLLRERIELWSNRGQDRKSDIQCMYIDRPQTTEQ
ncbi:hypothetical protein SBOR_7221 [Sclerotinia borealis F-4128]|uniref:N-acetyltransferase domain-containing protein n=1 Tax=Sclerotinia borealis (strain F-4128) TaxID=1432307 RepID=W9C9E6_SCLBF|nr:hypothetical protein SBOR_7221 [Sclerotinia borealis F-4128]